MGGYVIRKACGYKGAKGDVILIPLCLSQSEPWESYTSLFFLDFYGVFIHKCKINTVLKSKTFPYPPLPSPGARGNTPPPQNIPTAHPFWVGASPGDQVVPSLIRGSQGAATMENLLSSHYTAPPGFPWAPPPIKYCWEDVHPWEFPLLAILPSQVPTGGFHHSYFVHIFYLAYINIILLARSKSAATKMFEL